MVIHRLFCNRETYARVVVCGDPNGFNCLFGCILGWLAEGPVRIIRARVIAAESRSLDSLSGLHYLYHQGLPVGCFCQLFADLVFSLKIT